MEEIRFPWCWSGCTLGAASAAAASAFGHWISMYIRRQDPAKYLWIVTASPSSTSTAPPPPPLASAAAADGVEWVNAIDSRAAVSWSYSDEDAAATAVPRRPLFDSNGSCLLNPIPPLRMQILVMRLFWREIPFSFVGRWGYDEFDFFYPTQQANKHLVGLRLIAEKNQFLPNFLRFRGI